MARRVVIGQQPDGTMDIRISRPGFDAGLEPVNMPGRIAFAASRGETGLFLAGGIVAGLGNFAPFAETVAPLVPFWHNEVDTSNGVRAFREATNVACAHIAPGHGLYSGNATVAVVEPGGTGLTVVNPVNAPVSMAGHLRFNYMAIGKV